MRRARFTAFILWHGYQTFLTVEPLSSERFRLRLSHARYRTTSIVHTGAAADINNRHFAQTTRAPLKEWIVDKVLTFRTKSSFGAEPFLKSNHISICDNTPPTKNATTHVPVQTSDASFHPRSLSMTINEAMHGVKSVIVTSATTT